MKVMTGNKLERGDVYWVNLSSSQGTEINKERPCVIMSATPINQARHTVVIVPLSSQPKIYLPIVVPVTCDEKPAIAICDQIRAIDKRRIKRYYCKLSAKDLNTIEDSLRQVLVL